MPAGNPIFRGSLPNGVFWPQPSAGFQEVENGFDTGQLILETRATTPRSQWPTRNQRHGAYHRMYVTDVKDTLDTCGQILRLDVTFRGVLRFSGSGVEKPHKLYPGTDTQILTLPGNTTSGSDPVGSVITPVPIHTLQREYLTLTRPTRSGVGLPSIADFLGDPGDWSLTFFPDPEAPPSVNYFINTWVLQSRTWEDAAEQVWFVQERYAYSYSLAV